MAAAAEDRYAQVEQRLRALHPYTLPAIYSLRPEQALPAFADWVRAGSTPAPPPQG